jgi:hypothetical protein
VYTDFLRTFDLGTVRTPSRAGGLSPRRDVPPA